MGCTILPIPRCFLPSPYDRDPTFPPVFFRHGGEPFLLKEAGPSDGPPGAGDSTIYQIAPWVGNPYVKKFGSGGGSSRQWVSPETALCLVEAWGEIGLGVVIHRGHAGV